MESGGTRNYEVYKDKERSEEEMALEKEKGEKEDPMKALENRVLESQREMADLDNLEEIRAMNRKHLKLMSSSEGGGFDAKAVLKALDDRIEEEAINEEEDLNEHGITEEEERLVQSIQFGRKKKQQTNSMGGEIYGGGGGRKLAETVRLGIKDEKREEEKRKKDLELIQRRQAELDNRTKNHKTKTLGVPIRVKAKRRRIEPSTTAKPDASSGTTTNKKKPQTQNDTPSVATPVKASGLAGLLGDYGSSSDSD